MIDEYNSQQVDEGFRSLFLPQKQFVVRELPVDKLRDFFSANIGFRPYTADELQALADSIEEDGLIDVVIVRPIPNCDEYEILSGMHRVRAFRLKSWSLVPCRVVEVANDRAVMIATEANLKRRQNLLPSERGFAYRAQLEALKHQGKRLDLLMDDTSVQIEQKLTSRQQVAKINGVDANEVFRLIRLTYLIPPLLDLVDRNKLKQAVAVKLSYYSEAVQKAVYADCFRGDKVVHRITKKMADRFYKECPPPDGEYAAIKDIIIEGTAPSSKQISFDRRLLEPYLAQVHDEKELEALFFEFLQSKFDAATAMP